MKRLLRFGGLPASRSEIESEVDAELRFHIERKTEKLIEQGLSPQQAREEALRRFGPVERVRADCVGLSSQREQRTARAQFLFELGEDLRQSARALLRRPGFTVAAVLSLAIGIGANTAIFSLVDAVLLRELPFQRADELVAVWPEGGRASLAELDRLREAEAWQTIEARNDGESLTLTGVDRPERLRGVTVTHGLFPMLGVPARLGRLFDERDARPESDDVVLLSERTFRTTFAGDPSVLGSSITLDGAPRVVVGVLPADFRYPDADTDLWLPLALEVPKDSGFYWGSMFLELIARLRPDVTPEAAGAEVRLITERLRAENPIWTPDDSYGSDASVVPLQEHMGGDLKQLLLLLMAAVAAVLLTVCVNLANLLVARSSARSRETAIRASLGAGRFRLVTFLLTESALLATAGAALGLLPAHLLVGWLMPRVPGIDQRFGAIGLDGRVLLFALAITGITTLAFGLVPALRAVRSDLRSALHAGPSGGSPSRAWTRRALVSVQVALAVVLVIGAGLLLRSFWERWQVDTGFESRSILTARLDPAEGLYAEDRDRILFYRELLDRSAALPSVESAALVDTLPMSGGDYMAHRVEGLESEAGRLPFARVYSVSPGYFRTLGIALLQGRDLTRADEPGRPWVAIVNRALAETVWPGDDAIGKRIGYPWPSDWIEVVGVVEDVQQETVGGEIEPTIYLPFAQRTSASASLVLDVAGEPTRVAGPLRDVVGRLDDQVPVNDVATLEGVLWQTVAEPRLAAILLGAFALIALTLGGLGIYGVVAFLVEQRRCEIGLRLALGASPGSIVQRIVRQSAGLAAIGIGIGLVATLGAQRLLEQFLFQTSGLEWPIYAAAALLLAATAVVAAWGPARRAASLDPVSVLREE